MSADEIIRLLQLAPHPEGGHFRETYRAPAAPGQRAASTAIYYMLRKGEYSAWHRVDAAEVWHWYAGSPLELRQSDGEDALAITDVLGPDLDAGERPQIVIPPHVWQSARTLGDFTLVGCTVAPAFEFSKFELADPELSRKLG